MEEPLLTRLRRRRGLIGQILAVFMMLQPVAAVLGADIAARDPLARAVLASFCSPSGGGGPASGGIAGHSCCLPGGLCAAGTCCGPVATVAALAVQRADVPGRPLHDTGQAPDARDFRWPQPTGPPSA